MIQFNHLIKLRPNAKLHFSGIGGIGMSGLAEIMHNLGYQVQGSDITQNYNTKRLEAAGIKVFNGHDASNLSSVSFFIKSSAIKKPNPELDYCESHGIPIISRADFLSELMHSSIAISVSGAHGKTTTTSIVASILEHAGLDPTVIVGGIIKDTNTNVRMGNGDFMVVEADESDGTFTQIPSTIAVVTNIDKEHLDYYGSFARVKEEFYKFVSNISFYGFAVLCIDDKHVLELSKQITNREIITYSIEHDYADVQAVNIRMLPACSMFDVKFSSKLNSAVLRDVKLNVPGLHSIQNALAGITIAVQLRLDPKYLMAALQEFKNVKRRFTLTNEVNGIKFIDDYAHHPSEIAATMRMAKQIVSGTGGKVVAVFQPHRYTRVQSLFKEFTTCFADADELFVADIYSAQEQPIPGITSEILAKEIKNLHQEKQVENFSSWEALPEIIKNRCNSNDLVIFLGAGNITEWAYKIPQLIMNGG